MSKKKIDPPLTFLTGHKCPDPTLSPTECPAGYFSAVRGQTACTQVNKNETCTWISIVTYDICNVLKNCPVILHSNHLARMKCCT